MLGLISEVQRKERGRMYVSLQRFSETEARYDISLRKGAALDNPVLVRVNISLAGARITVDSTKNQMSIAQASEFAQALLVGIQIADKLNNGQAVEASVEYDATAGTQ
jgi:hypothetical protein